MPTKIYVGNLPWRATDEQLTTMFSAHGEVTEARIVTDRETGRSRGFAFVTMTDASQAQSAIQAINGASMEGRALVVNEAREQSRPPRGPGRRWAPCRWPPASPAGGCRRGSPWPGRRHGGSTMPCAGRSSRGPTTGSTAGARPPSCGCR
ncbi:MAG: RNA-binding protein [Betaproteobacteria bacterium]|nr:RNA-binding protein [Betaproteobacteria bacterium]